MSDAATRILEQLQAQNDLRMQAANDIAQAVASRVNAENALTEAKANELFSPSSGWLFKDRGTPLRSGQLFRALELHGPEARERS